MSNVPWSKFSHVRGEALFQFHSIATRYHGLAIVEWRTWMLKYPVISLSYPDDLSIWLPVTNIVPGCEPYPVTCISMYISFSPTLPPPWWCINSIAGCTWLNPTSAHYSTSTVALFILPCIMSDLCPPYAPFFGFAGVSAAVSSAAGLKCWQFWRSHAW